MKMTSYKAQGKRKTIKAIVIHLIFALILGLFLVSLTSAQLTFEKNKTINLKIPCIIDGSPCLTTADCNLSIQFPNSTYLIDNKEMSYLSGGDFNYTLSFPFSGTYISKVSCNQAGINGTSTFDILINPAGIAPSDAKTSTISRSIYIIFAISILLFLAFLFTNNGTIKWTYFILFFIFALIAINLLFVSLQDEVVNPKIENFFDGFTAITIILYWFAGGLLAIMWVLTFLNTWIYKKNMQKIQRFE